jgi:hypothetical protein
MPRAGSGWHYNLIHDLVVAGGGQDARQIRQRFHLERFLTEVNCNMDTQLTACYRVISLILGIPLRSKHTLDQPGQPYHLYSETKLFRHIFTGIRGLHCCQLMSTVNGALRKVVRMPFPN